MVLYDIIKQGYLLLLTTKKGTFQRKKWCKYWFLFVEDTTQLALIYFKSEEQYIAREKNIGFIRFDDCLSFSVIGQQGSTSKNAMVVNTPKQRYIIAADSRYELHEWVYQLHNSLDEFKKREHGIYAIVANAPGSSSLDTFEDQKQQKSQDQETQPQGIYAVVRKTNIKPTRQAPPVPPRSDEMNILTDDDTPPSSAADSTGDKGRDILMLFGNGSDTDLAPFRKHKRSLSDSLVITKAIEAGPTKESADKNKGTSTLKKTTSATNLTTDEKVVEDDKKKFELPASVIRRGKRFNKRRKTIAHGIRRRSRSPPSEPPPPPPSGENPPPSGEKPEVNQAIIDALYALDEQLGQNVAVPPNDKTSAVAPIHIDHTTVFATFQSPPEAARGHISPTTGHILSPMNFDHPQSDVTNQNGQVQGADDIDFSPDSVDESHCIKPSAAAGKAKIDEVKGSGSQEEASKVKKVPPPVKPKPYKPSPPLRTTSYNRTVELNPLQSSIPVSPSSLKSPTLPDVKQNKEGTEPQKRNPPRVTFPQEIEKTVNKKVLTTFSLDDLNKEIRERGGPKGNPLSPTKLKNSSGAGAFPMRDDSSMVTTGSSTEEPVAKMKGNPMSPTKVKNYSFPTRDDNSSVVTTSTSVTHSSTEESMTKIFQNWPNHGLSNGSVSDPMSPVHSEPSRWRDSMADQHIYDDPWDRKLKAAFDMARSQGSGKAGDHNSLERRRTFSNGNTHMNGARIGPVNRSYSVDPRVRGPPRRGASIEDLYNKSAATAFTDNFGKKGVSSENLSSLDPSSPLYVYKKALKNHEQQRQQDDEKERSYTLPLKGSARRRSQHGTLQPSPQTAIHFRNHSAPSNGHSARMFTTSQNDNRKFTAPVQVQQQQQQQQQKQQQAMQYQKQQQQTMQYQQHMKDSLQAQPPRRPNATSNYPPKTTNYRPYALNIGGRPISTAEQNGISPNRKPMNGNPYFQSPVGMGPEDWRYYQSGTRMSYDKNSDTTILRSLV